MAVLTVDVKPSYLTRSTDQFSDSMCCIIEDSSIPRNVTLKTLGELNYSVRLTVDGFKTFLV